MIRKPKTKSGTESVIFRKAEGILDRQHEDGSVTILHFNNEDNYFTADAVAAEFWNMLDGKKTLTQIKESLIKKHKPPVEVFEEQLDSFLKSLQKHGLILRA